MTAGRAPQPSLEGVVKALRQVLDPCSISMGRPLDIVEMGLVDDVSLSGGRVHVALLLTDFACAHYAGLRRHVVDALRDAPGVTAVTVELATHDLWTADRIGRRPEGWSAS